MLKYIISLLFLSSCVAEDAGKEFWQTTTPPIYAGKTMETATPLELHAFQCDLIRGNAVASLLKDNSNLDIILVSCINNMLNINCDYHLCDNISRNIENGEPCTIDQKPCPKWQTCQISSEYSNDSKDKELSVANNVPYYCEYER